VLEAVKKSKQPKNATFPQLEASQEALQRVLARRPMLSYPPTGSWSDFWHYFTAPQSQAQGAVLSEKRAGLVLTSKINTAPRTDAPTRYQIPVV